MLNRRSFVDKQQEYVWIVNFNLLPLIIVNSPGISRIKSCPIRNIWWGKTKGIHSIGLVMCDAKVMRQMSDDIIQFHAID